MAKKARKSFNRKDLLALWWVHGLLSLVAFGLSYVFASLAIDSGSLLQYAVSIALAYYGISKFFRAARIAIAK